MTDVMIPDETFSEPRESLIRTKTTVEVELILTDGTSINGMVYIWAYQRVIDLLNDPHPFFAVRLHSDEIILVAKATVAICKPLDRPG